MTSPLKDDQAHNYGDNIDNSHRSCSANQLDVIVDILGVPSELLSQRDFNKRLFLLKDKQKIKTTSSSVVVRRRPKRSSAKVRAPVLETKSKSCEEEGQELLVETKRRSIYAHDCRGRTEAQTCNKCQVVAEEVKDMELNREMFDIDEPIADESPPTEDELEEEEDEEAIKLHEDPKKLEAPDLLLQHGGHVSKKLDAMVKKQTLNEEEVIEVLVECPAIDVVTEPNNGKQTLLVEEQQPISGTTRSPRSKRRFDAVKSLLEKARHKLTTTRQFWSRSRSRSRTAKEEENSKKKRVQSQGPPELSSRNKQQSDDNKSAAGSLTSSSHLTVPDSGLESGSQSSPSTPDQLRKNKRNRSFSPVRYKIHN